MSELLDQQMPVKRKRRRPFAWWWTAAMWLLPLVGAGAWWWTNLTVQDEQKQRPDAPNAHTPSPIVSTPSNPARVPENRTATSAPTTPARSELAPQASKTSIVSGENTASAAQSVAPTAPHFSTKNIVPSHIAAPILVPKGLPPTAVDASEAAKAEDELNPSELAFLATALTLTILPARFQLLENPANTHQLRPFAPTKKAQAAKPKKKEKPKPVRIGAMLSIATERFTAANSALAGAALDWQTFRHWGLRSGLMYEYYRPSGFARPIAEINADEYADATRNYAFLFNNGVYVPGTSEALGLDVALPVTLMQRLRMPLLAYWQPTKRLRAYGGASFSYTMRVHTSSKGLAFDTELVGARSPSSMSRVNKLATEELPRFQTQLQTGLGVRVGKRWEVEMAYRQSAKIQFKSLFEKRVEDGQPLNNTAAMGRRPNHHFFTLSGIYFF